jgi:hypothetical protein
VSGTARVTRSAVRAFAAVLLAAFGAACTARAPASSAVLANEPPPAPPTPVACPDEEIDALALRTLATIAEADHRTPPRGDVYVNCLEVWADEPLWFLDLQVISSEMTMATILVTPDGEPVWWRVDDHLSPSVEEHEMGTFNTYDLDNDGDDELLFVGNSKSQGVLTRRLRIFDVIDRKVVESTTLPLIYDTSAPNAPSERCRASLKMGSDADGGPLVVIVALAHSTASAAHCKPGTHVFRWVDGGLRWASGALVERE